VARAWKIIFWEFDWTRTKLGANGEAHRLVVERSRLFGVGERFRVVFLDGDLIIRPARGFDDSPFSRTGRDG